MCIRDRAISWHLAKLLGLDPAAHNRVTFGEITKKGVQEGMAAPRAIDMDLFLALDVDIFRLVVPVSYTHLPRKIIGRSKKRVSIFELKYDLFVRKSAYLSSKILTLFLERPIIFLGYSVSDPNIRRILRSISECLENSQLEQLKKRLIFIEWTEDPEEEGISERQFDFDNGKTIIMENIKLFDYSILYSAILDNTVKYDVKALRRIKSQLYELVKTNKPTEKLYVATNIEDDSQDIDFVVGVGVYGKFGKVGYRGIKAEELYLYAIGQSDLQYDDDMILKEAIPYLYNGRTIWPVRQFVSRCQSIDCVNDKVKFSLDKTSKDLLSFAQKESIKKRGYTRLPCVVDYYRQYGLSKTISTIFTSDFSKINPDDLLQFIKLALEDEPALLSITGKGHQSRSNFKKCITLWDILVYSTPAKQRIAELSDDSNVS